MSPSTSEGHTLVIFGTKKAKGEMSSAAAAPWYLQLVRLVPPASVSVEVVGEDSQKSPDVRLQVPPGNLLQGDEGGHGVALDLHLGLGEDVQVVGVQVGALVSSADAEAHAPLGQLPADPFLGVQREGFELGATKTRHQEELLWGQHRVQEGAVSSGRSLGLARGQGCKNQQFFIKDVE